MLQPYHCGAVLSVWLGTITQDALPEVGQQLQGTACYGYAAPSCCSTEAGTVTVLNCHIFYVYFLYPTEAGLYERYCVTAEN